MKDHPPPPFDMNALRDAAGDKIFARGEAYHEESRVEILFLGANRVTARVLGGQRYRVVLERRTDGIDGECSCPAYLAANDRTTSDKEPGEDIFERIREYLRGKDTDALVEMIMARRFGFRHARAADASGVRA